MKKVIVFLVFLMISPTFSYAQGIADHIYINEVRVDASGKGYVYFYNALTNTRPACTTSGYVNALSFDANTAGGKAVMTLVLTAKALGKKIFAYGTGVCSDYTVMESWSWGIMKD